MPMYNLWTRYIYVYVISYTGSEEGGELPIFVLDCKLGYMWCVYNDGLNRNMDNDIIQCTNVQQYINININT